MIVNTAQGGGGDAKLNVYAQPDLPTDKFDGILLQTSAKETLKKVIFDDNPWAAGQFIPVSPIADQPIGSYAACYAQIGTHIYRFGGYILGGDSPYAGAWRYDYETNTYSQIADLPITLYRAVSIAYNNKIYIFGGYTNSTSPSNKIYCYDPNTDTYSAVGNLPDSSVLCKTAIIHNNIIYLFYAKASVANATSKIFQYNPETYSLAQVAQSLDVSIPYCVVDFNNRAWIFDSHAIYYYDYDSSTYTTVTSNSGMYVNDINAGIVVGDKIFIVTYSTGDWQLSSYDPSTNTLTLLTDHAFKGTIGIFAMVSNLILCFESSSSPRVSVYALTAKQYTYSPSAVVYRLPKDTTYQTILLQNKICDGLPVTFKDVMLFKDGNLTYPALYVGDGTQWIKEREVQ